jgi:4-amino-4-deoxy-L-arabinose transferase-like glycosyltransferase
VYRRGEIFDFNSGKWFTEEWYLSHYYYGVAAAMLMIFSLAIFPEIYRDRTNRWRTTHVVLNCLAVLIFLFQGMSGTRDLLEIPLSWQTQHIGKCDFVNNTCPP